MRCNKIKILMSASLDNELTDKEKLVLEQHISECAECAREMEALAGLRVAMSSWKDEEPSERLALSFSYKLQELTDNKVDTQVRRPNALIFGKVAAGFVVMLAVAGLLMRNNTVEPVNVASTSAPVSVYTAPIVAADNSEIIKQDIKPTVSKSLSNRSNRQVMKNRSNRTIAKAHKRIPVKRVMVAYVPRDDYRNSELASRHAERIIMQKMAYARSVENETAVTVVNNLSEANLKMNQSFERLRGTLRTAADLLSAEQQPNENTSATDGDMIL
ncbi:MAG: anti-sigma factor family protein [Armatimonadota bacterium]